MENLFIMFYIFYKVKRKTTMTYSFNAWETINLPAVSGDTYYIIYSRTTSSPGDDLSGIIYSGLILDGYSLQNLNEILTQYLRVELPIFDPSNAVLLQDDEQIYTFYIYYTQDDWQTSTRDDITVSYNWSYEPYTRSKTQGIINLVDYRQYIVYSLMSRDGTEEPVSVTLGNRTIDNFVIESDSTWTYIRNLRDENYPGEFTIAYSYDFFVHRTGEELINGTYVKLMIGGKVFYVTNTCYKYALYYLNELGGYDYMLFGGREMQTDDFSKLSYKKNYVANSLDFHKNDYLTTINRTWSLNTSWLNDIQSDKMSSLMSSNRVYLHNLETQELIPVNITNKSCEHKTYRNQGRKLYTYTLELSASQPKYRI